MNEPVLTVEKPTSNYGHFTEEAIDRIMSILATIQMGISLVRPFHERQLHGRLIA